VREGDELTAICLKKYTSQLNRAVQAERTGSRPGTLLDRAAILDGISEGLRFLHETLGLVHNDINPSNIMLDDAGNAVIIDFDSCLAIGQEIGNRKAGTFTWEMKPAPKIATPENDMHGLKLISEFLKEPEPMA
jgi:serine/threonine protein kinase